MSAKTNSTKFRLSKKSYAMNFQPLVPMLKSSVCACNLKQKRQRLSIPLNAPKCLKGSVLVRAHCSAWCAVRITYLDCAPISQQVRKKPAPGLSTLVQVLPNVLVEFTPTSNEASSRLKSFTGTNCSKLAPGTKPKKSAKSALKARNITPKTVT